MYISNLRVTGKGYCQSAALEGKKFGAKIKACMATCVWFIVSHLNYMKTVTYPQGTHSSGACYYKSSSVVLLSCSQAIKEGESLVHFITCVMSRVDAR